MKRADVKRAESEGVKRTHDTVVASNNVILFISLASFHLFAVKSDNINFSVTCHRH